VCIIVPNVLLIDKTVAEYGRFFQDGGLPPSWIFKTSPLQQCKQPKNTHCFRNTLSSISHRGLLLTSSILCRRRSAVRHIFGLGDHHCVDLAKLQRRTKLAAT